MQVMTGSGPPAIGRSDEPFAAIVVKSLISSRLDKTD